MAQVARQSVRVVVVAACGGVVVALDSVHGGGLLRAGVGLAACAGIGAAVGQWWAVVVPWAVLAALAVGNLAGSPQELDLFAGLFFMAALAALAATGTLIGVALSRSFATRGWDDAVDPLEWAGRTLISGTD